MAPIPTARVRASTGEYPFVKFDDQTTGFGDGDELARQDKPTSGMPPARQRLLALDLPG